MTAEPLGAGAAAPAVTGSSEGALGIGVIGTGTIASWHLNSYRSNPDAHVVAVCDANTARAQSVAATYDAQWYDDYTAMLADPAIAAVSICTRNDSHSEIAVAALEAGKSVLVEKPLGRTVAEAQAIVDAEQRSPGIVQVGFVRRFSPNARVLKSFIDAGDLGEIYLGRATCLRSAGNPGGWFADKDISGGGPLIDVGVHFIDIAWWLMGSPQAATVSGYTFDRLGNRANLVGNLSRYVSADFDPARNSVEDLAGGIVRFTNGAVLTIDSSYSIHGRDDVGVSLYGERGGAQVEPELAIFTEQHDTALEITPRLDSLTFDGVRGFSEEVASFVRAARGQAPCLAPASDGLVVTQIVSAIYESAARGAEIQF